MLLASVGDPINPEMSAKSSRCNVSSVIIFSETPADDPGSSESELSVTRKTQSRHCRLGSSGLMAGLKELTATWHRQVGGDNAPDGGLTVVQ